MSSKDYPKRSKEWAEARKAELQEAFDSHTEEWMDFEDLILLGQYKDLKPGERVSSETGELRYSAAWLDESNAVEGHE